MKEQDREVIIIGREWSNQEECDIKEYLKRAHALLATREYTIKASDKNKIFNRKYPLTDQKKTEILKSLSIDDCIAYESNNNPRYPDSTVFKFIKEVTIPVYGEMQLVKIYIKQYICENKNHELIIVISFHEEGMHDE